MKKFMFLSVIIFTFIYNSITYGAESTVPEAVQKSAIENIDQAIQILMDQPKTAGIQVNNIDELNNIKLGRGYKLHYVDNEKIDSIKTNNLLDMTIDSNHWQYILYLNDQPLVLYTIGLENGKYEMVQLGGAGNANKLDEILKIYDSRANQNKITDAPKLVKYGPNNFILVGHSENNSELVLSTKPSDESGLSNNDFSSPGKLVNIIKNNRIKQKNTSGPTKAGSSSPLINEKVNTTSKNKISTTSIIFSFIMIFALILTIKKMRFNKNNN